MRRHSQRNRNRTNEEQTPKQSAASKIARVLDVPQNVLSTMPTIELMGNKEAIVEGCKGVLEYDEETVRLNLGETILKFTGRDLALKCMTSDGVIVEGYILSIEFQSI
ncbi:YabP/YqfC family sporulation protein [Candidatus Soleaferrea massiliensis]|uniref:YabP/YqfC family sporulation protein n=1 Tax=Candidatus Soleaferrea massiliensis TaxID=1470354 RepID=UPI000694E87D|nr:YabP/YqfC family sporulation protein [Candidatus Soleaferrea massiliensis]